MKYFKNKIRILNQYRYLQYSYLNDCVFYGIFIFILCNILIVQSV